MVRVAANDVVGRVSAEDGDCLFDLAHNCCGKSSEYADDGIAYPLGEGVKSVSIAIHENLRSD